MLEYRAQLDFDPEVRKSLQIAVGDKPLVQNAHGRLHDVGPEPTRQCEGRILDLQGNTHVLKKAFILKPAQTAP